MTKETINQKTESSVQTYSTNNTLSDNMDIKNCIDKKLSDKDGNEFIFLTPMKNMNLKYYIPSTPKKNRNVIEYQSFPIQRKNLLNIFESM